MYVVALWLTTSLVDKSWVTEEFSQLTVVNIKTDVLTEWNGVSPSLSHTRQFKKAAFPVAASPLESWLCEEEVCLSV